MQAARIGLLRPFAAMLTGRGPAPKIAAAGRLARIIPATESAPMKKTPSQFNPREPGGKGTDRASQTQEARARQARQAEALRENLKKRKAQARAKTGTQGKSAEKGASAPAAKAAPKAGVTGKPAARSKAKPG